MAALGSPARTLRGLLRELRYMNAATGRPYRDTAAYRYLVKAFRAHRVTSEKLCRAQHELHFQAATYLCLLRSIREHVTLHQEFHGKGERSVEESAGLVGLKLPQQPGGKGWEPWEWRDSLDAAFIQELNHFYVFIIKFVSKCRVFLCNFVNWVFLRFYSYSVNLLNFLH